MVQVNLSNKGGIMSTWYWYISGAVTVLFFQSVLLNYALMNGWIKISRERHQMHVVRAYDQDKSRELQRAK
jgi:hypothetical protein